MTASTTSRFETRGEMLVRTMTAREVQEAKRITNERNKRHANSPRSMIRDTWVGALGEIAFSHYMDYIGAIAKWYKHDDLDYDFTVGDRRVDTKTRFIDGAMRKEYRCNVWAKQATTKPGDYFFLAYDPNSSRMWVCGGMERELFMAEADFLRKGDPSPENPRLPAAHDDMYHIRQEDILSPYLWTTTLPMSAWPAMAEF